MQKITNHQVAFDKQLINSGRFMIHGVPTDKGQQFDIEFQSDAPAAGFSIIGSNIDAIPVEDFLEAKTDSYLLSVGIGLSWKDKLILGLRPEKISVAPNQFTVAGGRCSEDPSITGFKELAEEFVLLATKGSEKAFVSFRPTDRSICPLSSEELRELQTHAIESLSYADQAKATHWVDGVVEAQSFEGEKTVSFVNEMSNELAYLPHAHPCVIEAYKTIDTVLPHKLTLPEGWEIEEVFFVEHPDLTGLIETPEYFDSIKDRLTDWAAKLVELHIQKNK